MPPDRAAKMSLIALRVRPFIYADAPQKKIKIVDTAGGGPELICWPSTSRRRCAPRRTRSAACMHALTHGWQGLDPALKLVTVVCTEDFYTGEKMGVWTCVCEFASQTRARMHTYLHIYTRTHAHTRFDTLTLQTYTHTHPHTHTHTHTHTHASTHTHTHTRIHRGIHTHTHTHASGYTHILAHTHSHTHTHTQTQTHTHVLGYIHPPTHTQTHPPTPAHTCTHAHIHTHTHTHTPAQRVCVSVCPSVCVCMFVCVTNVRIVKSIMFVCLLFVCRSFSSLLWTVQQRNGTKCGFFLDSVMVNTVVHTEFEACQKQSSLLSHMLTQRTRLNHWGSSRSFSRLA